MLEWVCAPTTPVLRIARNKYDPFKPPSLVGRLKRAGSRFDDPHAPLELPQEEKFSALYFATRTIGAFVEVLAPLRLNLDILAKVPEEEYTTSLALAKSEDIIDEKWCSERHIGKTYLGPSLRFVDCLSAANLQTLRATPRIAKVTLEEGYEDFDLGAIYGSNRRITQEVSRYVYEQINGDKEPLFAGLRYKSRLNNEECWAVFYNRMLHKPYSIEPVRIGDPALIEAVALLSISMAKP